MNPIHRNKKIFTAILALLGCFALIAQLILAIDNRTTTISEAIVRFFSYFTILTNLLVAGYCILLFLPGFSRLKRFIQRPGTITALTVYITVVGITYQFLLRHIWEPQGLQRVVDELLHSIIPLLVVVYWVLYEDKRQLKWRFMLFWLVYPLIYAIYLVIYGHFSGFYPYPFVDVNKLGYPTVMANSVGLFVAFFFFSGALIGIGKLTVKR
jgi:hypothetical protein